MRQSVFNLIDIDLDKIKREITEENALIVYPTDTVYGVGGSMYSIEAIEKIYAAKEREFTSPLIALVSDVDRVQEIAHMGENREKIEKLMKEFWPGALTIILDKKDSVPARMVSGGTSVGVRMPNHPVALDIIEACGGILPTTSANISGEPSPKNHTEVSESFKSRVEIVVEGGDCPVGIESTILDMRGEPKILRAGGISKEELEEVIGKI
ncbi:threonylcarbamoyl-AMP synthase [Propionigenium maris DSM 9537]|uniref:L-threonylcarbamoyladenylate synthase n=1 Tax=Propionigenium maris DSM 9537 TaxID=1123000 RepID=A0A9W6GMG9_9FUSO|nr:L-threonylcarbamoyladenylate synthase [Propionigenium maris]GLI56534.1 threonylcarbamoyl-AMP synthase [Propionigenium maris DSM 9537]